MGINLAIILGSGIELDKDRTAGNKVIIADEKGVHKKQIYVCSFEGNEILVLEGRRHFYEGYTFDRIVSDVKIINDHGVKNLLVTNAAGGVNDNFRVSELMLILSYVNLNNFIVHRKKAFPYDSNLAELFRYACEMAKVRLHEGVYGYYQGPTYETRAEIRFQKKFNIDAAGMSTIPETIESNSKRIRVMSLSVITNLLKENIKETASHHAVLSSAKAASAGLNRALSAFIPQLN